MNIHLPFTWRFDTLPSLESLQARSSLSEEALSHCLAQPVEPFIITIPMFVAQTSQRSFPGGTLLSLLLFLYTVYHEETVPLEELTPMLHYPQPHVVERFKLYIDQTLNGSGVRCMEMLYPNTVLTRIRRNKALIDWE
jgi:hypothetical protein